MKQRYLSYRDFYKQKRALRRMHTQTHKQLITFTSDISAL